MKYLSRFPFRTVSLCLLGAVAGCRADDSGEIPPDEEIGQAAQALFTSTVTSYVDSASTVLAGVNGKKTIVAANAMHSVWALEGKVYYAKSTNAITWTTPAELDSNEAKNPAIAVTSNGTIAVVYRRTGGIYYLSSPPGGTWSAPLQVTSSSGTTPAIAAYENDVHLAWAQGRGVAYTTFAVGSAVPVFTAAYMNTLGSLCLEATQVVTHPSIAVSSRPNWQGPVVRVAWHQANHFEDPNCGSYNTFATYVAEKPADWNSFSPWPIVNGTYDPPVVASAQPVSLSLTADRATGDFYLVGSAVMDGVGSTWLRRHNAQSLPGPWPQKQILPRQAIIDVTALTQSGHAKVRIAYSDFTQGSNGYGPTYYRTGQWTSGATPTWEAPAVQMSTAGRMGTALPWDMYTRTTRNTCYALFETWSGANNYALVDACDHAQRLPPVVGRHLGLGRTDLTVRRPSDARFDTLSSDMQSSDSAVFGAAADIPVDGDFDGDGKSDYALWTPATGQWDILQTSTKTHVVRSWGTSGDIPLSGDFDGDGKTDISVWRPSQTKFYTIRSSDNQVAGGVVFGASTDIPVNGDFDGDWKADWALFRPSTGTWNILQSSTNTHVTRQWGTSGDVPLSGDFDGDGKTDISVWRPSQTKFYTIRSSDNQVAGGVVFGASTDIPVNGDFDGDGKADWALFRPSTGTWDILQSSTNSHVTYQWGKSGDIAMPPPQE